MVQHLEMNGEAIRQELLNGLKVELEPKPQSQFPGEPWKRKVAWPNAIFYLIIHLTAVYGAYVALTRAHLTFIWAFILGIGAGLSITMGAHRLYSHRAFTAKPMLRLTLVLLQLLTGQHCMWVWVRDHRQHHKYSDTDADPHNAKAGFFFSHIGWLMCYKHPDVIRVGKDIDMSDVDADPFVMFQKKYFKSLYFLVSFAIPTAVPVLMWGEDPMDSILVAFIFRSVVSINCTWMVNSYAHMFGTKPYSQDILPVETSLVAFLSLGEGWHNYHHTFPWDYRAAEFGKELNFTTSLLDLFARWGWVYDLRAPSLDLVKSHLLKHGDGSHPIACATKHH